MFVAKLKYHRGATFTARNESDGTPDPKRRKSLTESAGVVLPHTDAVYAYMRSLSPRALSSVESVEVYSCPVPRNEYMLEVQEHHMVGYSMRLEGSYPVKGNRVEVGA